MPGNGRVVPVACLIVLWLCIGVSLAQEPEDLARESAKSWLALVDSGRYGESWDQASPLFKAHVTREQWQQMLDASRDPLGKIWSRKLESAAYTKTLPGAPGGEYVVIRYDTSFEHKQSAVETITPQLDKDGSWRVSGYFIK